VALNNQPPRDPTYPGLFPSPLVFHRLPSSNHFAIHNKHHFLSNRSLKGPSLPRQTSYTSPPPNKQHIRLARHYYSRRSLTSTFQYKPSPKFTPKTPSLCQAKPRSRISRAAVRHFAIYSPFGERVPPCFCRCNGFDGRDTVDGYVGLDATECFHFATTATTATTRPRIGIQHEAASLTRLIFRPLRRSRRRLGTDYPNPRIHPYSHSAYVASIPHTASAVA
jgi:hypothetical protein